MKDYFHSTHLDSNRRKLSTSDATNVSIDQLPDHKLRTKWHISIIDFKMFALKRADGKWNKTFKKVQTEGEIDL